MAIDTMNQEEIRAFGDKLDRFGRSLSLKEQILLREILSRAASASSSDVQGYAANMSWSTLLALLAPPHLNPPAGPATSTVTGPTEL